MAVQKANQEVPTLARQRRRRRPCGPASHPMMNAVGGTSLHYWAQSWRLNPWDFKVVSETTRRYGASRIPKGSTVEDWPFGLRRARAVLRQGRVRDRRVGQGRQHQGHDRSARQPLRGRAQARVSDAAAALARSSSTRWRDAAQLARLASVSRDRRRSTRAPIRIAPAACITASATAAAATSTPRTRPPSRPFRAPRRPVT